MNKCPIRIYNFKWFVVKAIDQGNELNTLDAIIDELSNYERQPELGSKKNFKESGPRMARFFNLV